MKYLLIILVLFLPLFPVFSQTDEPILLNPDFFVNNHRAATGSLEHLFSKMDKYVFYVNFWFTHPIDPNPYIIRIDDDIIDDFPEDSTLDIIDGTLMIKLPFFDEWTPGLLLDVKQEHLSIPGGGEFNCFNGYWGLLLEYNNLFRLSIGNRIVTLPNYAYDEETHSYYFTAIDDSEYHWRYENIDINLSLYNFSLNSLYDFTAQKLFSFGLNYWKIIMDIDWIGYVKYIDLTHTFLGGLRFETDNRPNGNLSFGGNLQFSQYFPFIDTIDLYGKILLNENFLVKAGVSYVAKCHESTNVIGFDIELCFNRENIIKSNTWMGVGISRNYKDYLEKWPFPGELILNFSLHTSMTKEKLDNISSGIDE